MTNWPFQRYELVRILLIKLAYHPSLARWLAQLTDSAFNWLGQYASSPGNRANYYAKLAVPPLSVAMTIASTSCAYP